MKLANLEKAKDLAWEIERLKALVNWRRSISRGKASLNVVTLEGTKNIEMTFDEADAIIDRYEDDLAKRAAEIGVEL